MEKGRRMFSVGRTLIYPEFIFSFNMCLKNTFIEPVISDKEHNHDIRLLSMAGGRNRLAWGSNSSG